MFLNENKIIKKVKDNKKYIQGIFYFLLIFETFALFGTLILIRNPFGIAISISSAFLTANLALAIAFICVAVFLVIGFLIRIFIDRVRMWNTF